MLSIFQAKSCYATNSIISHHLPFLKCNGIATNKKPNSPAWHQSLSPHDMPAFISHWICPLTSQGKHAAISHTAQTLPFFASMLTPLLHSPSVDIPFVLFRCISDITLSVDVSLVSYPFLSEGISPPSSLPLHILISPFHGSKAILLNIMASILHVFLWFSNSPVQAQKKTLHRRAQLNAPDAPTQGIHFCFL